MDFTSDIATLSAILFVLMSFLTFGWVFLKMENRRVAFPAGVKVKVVETPLKRWYTRIDSDKNCYLTSSPNKYRRAEDAIRDLVEELNIHRDDIIVVHRADR